MFTLIACMQLHLMLFPFSLFGSQLNSHLLQEAHLSSFCIGKDDFDRKFKRPKSNWCQQEEEFIVSSDENIQNKNGVK